MFVVYILTAGYFIFCFVQVLSLIVIMLSVGICST